MAEASQQGVFGRQFARNLWRLTRIYWTSPDAWKGGLLLALAVSLELGAVYGNVLLAGEQRRIFDAVQDKQMATFFAAMGTFFGMVLIFVFMSAYRIYLRQRVEMYWRAAVTAHYIQLWIGPQAYCQQEMAPGAADNPDQRIAEDIRVYVASGLGLSLSLLAALATLVSFSGLLWNISADWPLQWRGEPIHIPGLMLWIAVIYAFISMGLTHLVGRPLVPINFDRQRVEADFRFGLVRFRENAEAVALARGGGFEQAGAIERFQFVVQNWWQLIAAQRNLTLLTTTIGQTNGVLPLLIAAPAYFAGWITLGTVVQTRFAYGQVSGALSWFMFAYQEIAQWRASIERLSTFAAAIDTTQSDMASARRIRIESVAGDTLRLADLSLALPDGRLLLEPTSVSIMAGDRIAIFGAAGSGKTTLFRALAGIWPFGSGRIEMPTAKRALFLPQKPYLPIGTLRDAVCYPAAAGTFSSQEITNALALLDLQRLSPRLDDTVLWEQQLSIDEKQRVTLVRLLLHRPDWIFLDDATAALDETMERRVFETLRAQLPSAALITMTHRPAILQYHAKKWTLGATPSGGSTLSSSA